VAHADCDDYVLLLLSALLSSLLLLLLLLSWDGIDLIGGWCRL
jgi:hypothetical protein